jgi:hypothetical protein
MKPSLGQHEQNACTDNPPCNMPILPNQFLTLHFLILRIEAARSSKTSVSTYKTAWCHKPEDHNMSLLSVSNGAHIQKSLANNYGILFEQ